jgi:diguanylate cyclase (GGDEF)-like protein
MTTITIEPTHNPALLMEIIRMQAEIVRLGPDLGAVMELAAERIKDMTGASAAIVELVDADETVYRAAAGTALPHLGMRIKRAGSLSGLSIDEARILSCTDSETDPRVNREACRRVGLRSMLVAPLLHNGTAVGAFKLASPVANGFGEPERSLLSLVSDLLAAAMFHSARYEQGELYHRATHDTLTGLANRALFYDRLRQALALAQRRRNQLGILMADMNGLKEINDTYGHRAGDAAIREAARRISGAIRLSDTAARLGGDEFGIIMADISGRDGARILMDRVDEQLHQPFRFEGASLQLGSSLGLALYAEDGVEIEALIEQADQAMYRAKRSTRLMAPVSESV